MHTRPLPTGLLLCCLFVCSFNGLAAPSTDLILYGKIYDSVTGLQITGSLPGAITAAIEGPGGAPGPVVATAASLFGFDGGPNEYYALRIKRFDWGTPRNSGDTFVLPGDRIHLYLNQIEVAETALGGIVITSNSDDVRFLNLNGPVLDLDGDGISDDWERLFFGSNSLPPETDTNNDGVTNIMAYAMGLNPLEINSSKLPSVARESGNTIVFCFRHSSQVTGLSYRVESNVSLDASHWVPMLGLPVQVVGVEGNSRILKAIIPVDSSSKRFLRIAFYR